MRRKLTSYRGLSAVVTGASSGIGKLLALRFAAAGARVALVARRVEALDAVATEIRGRGGEAVVVQCDVADRGQVEAAARTTLERFGTVDLLVNNAGYGRHRLFVDWDVADMERMLAVNVLGTIYWTKALLPRMVERHRGWLVFMASVAGKIGVPDESVYSASKFAVVGLAEALSLEVEDAGVHVLTVCPGAIRTEFFDAEARARMPPVAKRNMAEPEPLADAVVAALAAGKRELTYPRPLQAGYVVKALAPGLLRYGVKRTTLGAMPKPPPAKE